MTDLGIVGRDENCGLMGLLVARLTRGGVVVGDEVFDQTNAYVAFLNVNLIFLLIFYWPHKF